MIHSKTKEQSSKSSEQLRESFVATEKIIAGHCVMLMESKPWTIYWISQGGEKKHLNLLTMSESNTILTESKPEVQKTLIYSKLREGTAESSGITDT